MLFLCVSYSQRIGLYPNFIHPVCSVQYVSRMCSTLFVVYLAYMKELPYSTLYSIYHLPNLMTLETNVEYIYIILYYNIFCSTDGKTFKAVCTTNLYHLPHYHSVFTHSFMLLTMRGRGGGGWLGGGEGGDS